MEIRLSDATKTALRKAASSQRKSPEQFVEELLTRRYQTGVTVTDYGMIFDSSVDGWQSRFDSGVESKTDMVINIRMSDKAGVALTNAARQAKTTPEALVLKLVEEKYGTKQDASDPNLVRQVQMDVLATKERTAYEQYVERLKAGSQR